MKIQKGIFYQKKPFHTSFDNDQPSNDCFAILFLRISNNATAYHVSEALNSLWEMYKDFKKGNVRHLPGCPVPSGDLSVLMAFGPSIFNIPAVTRNIPRDFKDKQFLKPVAGGPILEGSGIKYAHDLHENLGTTEHIAFQFISRTQLAAN